MAIRVSVLYPAGNGKRFDHGYYANTHMPMAAQLLKPVHCEVDRGLGGGSPGSAAPHVAGCHFWFASLADFQAAIGAHGAALQEDIPNYTDIAPLIQVSEIVSVAGTDTPSGEAGALTETLSP